MTHLELHLPFASKISVTTTKEKLVRVHYQSEGEYQNDYLLRKRCEGKRLVIEEIPAPQKLFHNDKLSAHKVVATQITLVLPESLALLMFADEAQLLWEGNHPTIYLELSRGKALIKADKLGGEIKTSKADVDLFGLNGKVKMSCAGGRCINYHTKDLNKSLEIDSRQGNIVLYPS